MDNSKADRERRLQEMQSVISDFFLDDQDLIGVPLIIATLLRHFCISYGDECFRSIALFCLGGWKDYHEKSKNLAISEGQVEDAWIIASDCRTIEDAMTIIAAIGSFSGDQQWREKVKTELQQTLSQEMEGK